MAVQIVWSARARRDVRSIYDYIASDSIRHARAEVDRIAASTDRLRSFPQSGRRVAEDEAKRLREVISGSYRILYRTLSDVKIEIAAVVHGSRDIDTVPDIR